ncbi:TolC family protein [Entomohabitans teleogrylli]|uniref:TolC family protein n=1 Tax=Entomohabitans teleogrylli TaxID=1384589 RepID=UPI00073D5B30|nr:TolC family protein [Entomohabitans teleogrylli]
MKRHSLNLLWVGGVFLACLHAAAPAAAWSLPQTLLAAERYSAELSANRNQANALNSMAQSARELPDPSLKFGVENVPLGGSNARRLTRDGMTMQRIGIMQNYVSADKRERKAETLLAQSSSTQAQSDVIRAALQRDTASAWLELALSQKMLRAAQRLARETEKQTGAQLSGVASGASPASSVLDLRIALNAIRDRVTLAQRDVELAQTRLLALTGQNIVQTDGDMPRYQRLPADEALLEQAVSRHPQVIAAAREADVSRARSAQSAVAAKPDVGVEVYYAHRADGYDDMAGIMFSVDLPLFKSQRQDKDYAADVSRTLEANDRLALVERERLAQLKSLIARYQAALAIWQRQQQDVVPLTRQRLALLEARYRSGQSDVAALLEARRAVLDSEVAAISAEKELALNWAAIRYLVPEELTQ